MQRLGSLTVVLLQDLSNHFLGFFLRVDVANADQYIPGRWLGEEGKALQPYLIAFSAGARSCIGSQHLGSGAH